MLFRMSSLFFLFSGENFWWLFWSKRFVQTVENIKQTTTTLSEANIFISIFWGIVVYFWIITIIWVTKDCTKRMTSFFWQIVSIFLVTIGWPILWLPLYIAYRPIRYKEMPMAWKEALDLQTTMCPKCKMINPREYTYCLLCGKNIKVTCNSCNATYPYDYVYCPVCGTKQVQKNTKNAKTLKY